MADNGKKPVLSSKVMQLKFMQRAQEKQKRVEDTAVAEKKESEAQWVVDGSRTRCIVLAEGDPCSSTLGRVSFKGFNLETERLQQEAEQREARRAAAAATDLEGKSVSDEAMAAQLGKQLQQQQQQLQASLGKQEQQQQQQQRQQKQLDDEQILPLRPPKKQRR